VAGDGAGAAADSSSPTTRDAANPFTKAMKRTTHSSILRLADEFARLDTVNLPSYIQRSPQTVFSLKNAQQLLL
jgi:hypothetical protein